MWEQPHHAIRGQPPACLLSPHLLSRNLPGRGKSPPCINGGFVLAQGAQEPGMSQAGRGTPHLSSSSAVGSISLLCLLGIILTLAILTEQCQGHGQILKGPRLLSSAAFFLSCVLPFQHAPFPKRKVL